MAHKGRGIFLVYVDIDAQHDKEFNEWYNTRTSAGIAGGARHSRGGPVRGGEGRPQVLGML